MLFTLCGIYPLYFKLPVRWLCYSACGFAPWGQRKRCSRHEYLVLQLELFRVIITFLTANAD
ncbi:hypothetical protein MC52_024720 [Klebsiella michiganensis]|uniref:Uncharacterized protein n=1 Tax=Klebsiella michiganensis TaxID=1134687 RepID=A0A2K0KDA5_9ENTR|nr:hypothetical protein C2U44_14350 [Klebsiella oxytoca]PLO66273.1 hypothetical protein CWN49_21350 [Klebsiella michiganensis]AVE77166.1 hypothetical protein AM355_08045 [Klebsiella oxytoca]PLP24162.1 hypothetical protein CWM92_22865 [Klebsiella michiganensis]PNO45516.1 hypothetical protein MC52_024720 [Klebsiella michiganensis]